MAMAPSSEENGPTCTGGGEVAEVCGGKGRRGGSAGEEKRRERAARKLAQASEADDRNDDSSMWELKYSFQEPVGVVRITEDWSGEGNGIAGLQWLGGVVLCRYMDSRQVFPEDHFVGRRMIEVGAGCGLTSIYAALRGAHVTITDMDTGKCVDNVESNLAPRGMEANACVQRLEWGLAEEMARFEPPYDLVVAGDCLYEEACIVPLLQTMWALAGPSTEVLLCGVVGHGILDSFLNQVDLYFDRETVDTATVDTFAGAASVDTLGGAATAALAAATSASKASLVAAAAAAAGSATEPNSVAPPHDGEGGRDKTSTSECVVVVDGDDMARRKSGSSDAAHGEGEEASSNGGGGGLEGGKRPGQRALLRLRKKCDAAVFGGRGEEEGVGVGVGKVGVVEGGAIGGDGVVSAIGVVAAVATC